jgi:hypothetical protein
MEDLYLSEMIFRKVWACLQLICRSEKSRDSAKVGTTLANPMLFVVGKSIVNRP